MTPFLLSLLRDPITKEPLKLVNEKIVDGEIISGKLISASEKEYPIHNGIPRFVQSEEIKKSVNSFGDEWNHFNFIDFKHHWAEHTIKNTFGTTDIFKDKVIVDAGGGSGAQTKWMLEYGAKHLILLDLSHSIDDVVLRNIDKSRWKNVDIIQCSIDAPPFADNSPFDLVICHNVIQHTPSVEKTAEALFGITKRGGEFVFNCYPLNDQGPLRWVRFHLIYQNLRKYLSKQSFSSILLYSKVMGLLRLLPLLGYALDKLSFCVTGDIPIKKEEPVAGRLRRKYRATVLNTFDTFGSHAYQHHKSDQEILDLVGRLQRDKSKVLNRDIYFTRPMPIGCALRVIK